jgi:hypothetical protein
MLFIQLLLLQSLFKLFYLLAMFFVPALLNLLRFLQKNVCQFFVIFEYFSVLGDHFFKLSDTALFVSFRPFIDELKWIRLIIERNVYKCLCGRISILNLLNACLFSLSDLSLAAFDHVRDKIKALSEFLLWRNNLLSEDFLAAEWLTFTTDFIVKSILQDFIFGRKAPLKHLSLVTVTQKVAIPTH